VSMAWSGRLQSPRRSAARAAAPLLACALAATVALGACAASTPRSAAAATVAAAFEHYCNFLRAMDHAGMAAMFTADGEIANPGQEPIRGPAAIDAFLSGFSGYRVLSYTSEGVSIVVRGDSAELAGIFHQRVRVPQGNVVEVAGHLAVQWSRDGTRGWLIQRAATSPL